MTEAAVMIGGRKLPDAHVAAMRIALTTFHDELDKELAQDHTMRPTLARIGDVLLMMKRKQPR